MGKKLFTIVLVAITILSLSGCMIGDLIAGPSDSAKGILTGIQNGDIDDSVTDLIDESGIFSGDNAYDLLSTMGKSMEYTINSVSTENRESSVGITVKNKDMGKIFIESIESNIDSYFGFEGLEEEEFFSKLEKLMNIGNELTSDSMINIFIEAIPNTESEIITNSCELTFIKENNEWVLENNKSNKQAMGYIFGVSSLLDGSDVGNIIQSYITDKLSNLESDINAYIENNPNIDTNRIADILSGNNSTSEGSIENEGSEGSGSEEAEYSTDIDVTVTDCFITSELTDLSGNKISPYGDCIFVVVEVSGTNYGEYIDAFYVSSAYFVGSDNQTYYVASATWSVNDENSLINAILNSGETLEGYIVFEVPQQDVHGGELYLGEFSDNVFNLTF